MLVIWFLKIKLLWVLLVVYFTDYVASGKTSLGALNSGNGYGIFYYQAGAGRDGVDSVDIAFNTTTSATSVMSVKTNGEVKISGTVFASSVTAANILLSGNLGIGGAVPGGNLAGTTSLAIGDSDTGFRQNGDGNLQTWANNVLVSTSTSATTAFSVSISATNLSGSNSGDNAGVTSVVSSGGYGGLTLTGTNAAASTVVLGGAPTGTWPISVTGNANTAANSTYVDYLSGRTDVASYPILWGASQGTNPATGNAKTYAFSCSAVTIKSSDASITANAFYQSSDIRLKTLIDKEHNDSVVNINEIYYTWKNGIGTAVQLGYPAHEVQKYMPNAVNTDEDGMLSVNYIQVLVAKVAALENRLKKLE
jgi:hypothetical protein